MKWQVNFYSKFEKEFDKFSAAVQEELLSYSLLLEKFGPQLGRPWVDTLKASKYSNMKELRFKASNGVWRVAFAYDPKTSYIVSCRE